MNQELYNYISGLIDQGIDNFDLLAPSQIKKIVGYVLLDRKEPLEFLIITDAHKRLMHLMTMHLIGTSPTSILDVYGELEDSLMEYHRKHAEEAFDRVKVSELGAYPYVDPMQEYGVRRGE